MRLIPTELPGLVVVEPPRFDDDRGWFMETFHAARFDAALAALGLPPAPAFVQDNHSCSHAGVLRGMHFQAAPHAQGKLVRVVAGRAFDVAVDVRRGSPSFGRWFGLELTPANRRQLWVPAGFAHGLLALEDDTQVVYKVTTHHVPACERGFAWGDPAVGIRWPWPAGRIRSLARDAEAPPLAAIEPFDPA